MCPRLRDTLATMAHYLRYIVIQYPTHQSCTTDNLTIQQTWESPDIEDTKTGIPGDDDPLDVCEIGETESYCGEVKQVKLLGAFALLDEGETDWKIIAIDVNDPLASKISDIKDVEASFPGYLDSLKRWYCVYKVPDGKPENHIALGGKIEGRKYVSFFLSSLLSEYLTSVGLCLV